MKHFNLIVERRDLEFDKDQPTWFGEVLANNEDEARSVVLKLMDNDKYRHEVTSVEETEGETEEDEGRIAGVLHGAWEY